MTVNKKGTHEFAQTFKTLNNIKDGLQHKSKISILANGLTVGTITNEETSFQMTEVCEKNTQIEKNT